MKEMPYLEVPRGFPDPVFPEDNAFTADRWILGKKLFYSKALSRDESISCAHCHNQQLGFADDVAVSLGVDGLPGTRNASTLTNVAYQPYFTSEGGVPTLEMQIAVPVQEHNEFDFNMVEIAERLQGHSEWNEMSQDAYGRNIDPFVITRALACFERSLLSGNSPYDQQTYQGIAHALTEEQERGMEIFEGAGMCNQCHQGFNFSNYQFENNGLYDVYADSGRYRLTHLEEDIARFKVPTLRNVEYSAPYMHNGSLETLEDVVEHYSTGIKNHMNKSPMLENLNLSAEQKSDLVAFLKALSDEDFITNIKFREE